MEKALNTLKLKDTLMNEDILALIIGKEKTEKEKPVSNINNFLEGKLLPRKLNISILIDIILNRSQDFTLRNCLKHKLTVIKGPPGTGKSKILLFLAYHLLKLISFNTKIFIGAPSNRAVDNISALLQKVGIDFIRVLSIEKEIADDVDKTNSLEDLVQQEIDKDLEKNKRFQKFKEKRYEYGFLKGKDESEYQEIIKRIEYKILNSKQIIISNLNNAADKRPEECEFPIVIIDEATKALEPDCLLPLIHKAQMVVMIGDEKQLGPTLVSQENLYV